MHVKQRERLCIPYLSPFHTSMNSHILNLRRGQKGLEGTLKLNELKHFRSTWENAGEKYEYILDVNALMLNIAP